MGFLLVSFCRLTDLLSPPEQESIKPVLYSGDPAHLLSTRQTLYSCADLALRLLSPFMPYLTEELWQRLPKVDSASPPSICVARYPNTESLVSPLFGLNCGPRMRDWFLGLLNTSKLSYILHKPCLFKLAV